MKQHRHGAARDYGSMFVGMILTGLVVIVFVLMMAVGQSRERALPLKLRLGQTAYSALTSTIYSKTAEQIARQ